jgi:hypothetical protein
MPIVVDQLSLGNAGIDTTATTIPFTTTATVAVGGFIVVDVTWGSKTIALSSVSGGGLTWTIDKQGASSIAALVSCAKVSAQAPAGLASGTVITATYASTTVGRGISGSSYTGVATSSPVDTTSGPTDYNLTTAWTSASTTIAAGSLLTAVAHGDVTNDTSTITSPSIEAQDFGVPGGFCQTVGYRIEAAGGAFTVAGTWTGNESGTVVAVAYLAAPVTSSGRPLQTFDAIPFMSNTRI